MKTKIKFCYQVTHKKIKKLVNKLKKKRFYNKIL